MSIFSRFARKPQAGIPLTTMQIPTSTFNFRSPLSPDAILNARYLLDQGRLRPILSLYDTLLREDDATASAADVRSEALKSAPITLDAQNLSQPQIDYFNSLIKRFGPVYGDLLLALKLQGTLFRQIDYDFDGSVYTPARYLSYPDADLRLLDGIPVPHDGEQPLSLDPRRFITLHRDSAVLYSILKYQVFFAFALNNWAQFTETFGKPPRIAKYKPGTTEAEKEQLWAMLQSFGSDLAAMVSDNVAIDFADFNTKSASVDLYSRLCEFCDDRVTRRILGNTLTTKAVGDGGSYAQAKVHNLVRQDILAGDCRDLDVFLTAHFTDLNHINFGPGTIEVNVQPPADINLLERIQIDVQLYNSIGIEFPFEYWYETYNIPLPPK